MGELRFENQGEEYGPPPAASGFDMVGQLVKWGVVSTRQQAEYALIGVVALVFVVALFLFFGSSGSSVPPPPPVSAVSAS